MQTRRSAKRAAASNLEEEIPAKKATTTRSTRQLVAKDATTSLLKEPSTKKVTTTRSTKESSAKNVTTTSSPPQPHKKKVTATRSTQDTTTANSLLKPQAKKDTITRSNKDVITTNSLLQPHAKKATATRLSKDATSTNSLLKPHVEKATATRPPKDGNPTYSLLEPHAEKATLTRSTNDTTTTYSLLQPHSKKSSTINPSNKASTKKITMAKLSKKPLEPDPIIDHLREFHKSNPSKQDIHTETLHHIALEGLSGLTFRRLLSILNAIFPSFDNRNKKCQDYVWTLLVSKYLKYQHDASVRAHLVTPNRQPIQNEEDAQVNKRVFIDKHIKLPAETIKRVARMDCLLCPVQDNFIMGSCSNYSQRIDVTQDLIDNEKRQEVDKKLGLDNIFFVASQELRSRALFPSWADPNVDIKLREYCTLELIGKSRTLGTVFPNDKALGRYRIMLVTKGFITQYQQTSTSPIEHLLIKFQDSRNFDTAHSKPVKTTSSDPLPDEPRENLCFDPTKFKVDRSILKMVYDAIAESESGISQLDLRRQLNLPKFHIRNHLKNLISIKMVCSRSTLDPDNPFRIYKTAHKTRRKRRKVEKLEKPTGIMASWDEADLRAKKILGHKRSSFSQAEDSLLILCRITSILLMPNVKPSWCVHKRTVRNLLHKELIESHDKTSDACLRRIKYLKRLPNNIMSINELTVELSDDKEVQKLIQGDKQHVNAEDEADERLNKKFIRLFGVVREKIPNLLGISSIAEPGNRRYAFGSRESSDSIKFSNYEELKDKYEIVDCQAVGVRRAPFYEGTKVLDDKHNHVCLVTMAFILTGHFAQDDDLETKEAHQNLLEKFYSNYHDKLVSSVLSKLHKRSLLTRKCPAEQALLYKPKTKMSLKLNQSVLFLLNRYHTSSLLHLTKPLTLPYRIDLSESNEMSSIAWLTSLINSMDFFNLSLKFKIPTDVVKGGGEQTQGDLIVQPSNIKFYSDEQIAQLAVEPFNLFLEEKISSKLCTSANEQENPSDKNKAEVSAKHDAKEPGLSHARLWRRIDGSTHPETLIKLIESLLSRIIVFPGIERDNLEKEFEHLMPGAHLNELLELMEHLRLINSYKVLSRKKRALLFGYKEVDSSEEQRPYVVTYEPYEDAFFQYCQLLEYSKVISKETNKAI